jgi:AraC family transcriptional regulator
MKVTSRRLASGSNWKVDDIVCGSGPHDRPFEEQHDSACIAVVTDGTFQYRTTQGAVLLSPGAMLLGNDRHCYECGHEHGSGDRCLSFHFLPEFLESVAAAIPGVRRTEFSIAHLPPMLAFAPIIAEAVAARDGGDAVRLEEHSLRLAGAVCRALCEAKSVPRVLGARDGKRITEALRRIETEAHEQLTIADLARSVAMSPYHFLRTFRAVIGMTPYQLILLTRLHRASVYLRQSDADIAAIAFDAGFNDLSTFNRRFRRVMGVNPSVFRARGEAVDHDTPPHGYHFRSHKTMEMPRRLRNS